MARRLVRRRFSCMKVLQSGLEKEGGFKISLFIVDWGGCFTNYTIHRQCLPVASLDCRHVVPSCSHNYVDTTPTSRDCRYIISVCQPQRCCHGLSAASRDCRYTISVLQSHRATAVTPPISVCQPHRATAVTTPISVLQQPRATADTSLVSVSRIARLQIYR